MVPECELDSEEAFRQVLAHRTMLKAYVKSIVLDPFLAEDIFSEVTLQIVRSWDRFDQSRVFAVWARGVARRVALANLRKENRQPSLLDKDVLESIAEEVEGLGDESALDQRKEALRKCMGRLSERNRLLLRRRYFENRSYQEISRLVDKKVGALYALFSRLHHALLRCVERELRST
jgi:RNA polymerase sigma-70 factor (ECF subfamily)